MSFAPEFSIPRQKNTTVEGTDANRIFKFKSVRDMGESISAGIPRPNAANSSQSADFCEMQYQTTMRLCRGGGAWLEGAKNVLKANIPALGFQREVEALLLDSGPVGFAPNVGAYCANLPDSMLHMDEKTQVRPVLKIEVNGTIASQTPERCVLNRGRALLSVIRALETSGVSVEVSAYVHSSHGNRSLRLEVPLKARNEGLSAAKLAYTLCNAAFTRRIFCRLMETVPSYEKMTHDSYGKVHDKPSGNADIHFGALTDATMASTPESALAEVSAPILKLLKP